MENFDQFVPPMDPTKAKLRYKLSDYGLSDGVTRYEEGCVDLIIENLYVYMKSVIRRMVRHKRTYEIINPLFMDEEEKQRKEKSDEPKSKKKLKPWETPFDCRNVSPEFMKKIEENDLKEAKANVLRKTRSSQQCKDMKSNSSLNKEDSMDDSSVKVIEILKNLHHNPQEQEVQTRGKEETNVSQEGKFPQQNKQNTSKESDQQDESMDIVDVSDDEQSVSQVNDIKYQNEKLINPQLKNAGKRTEVGEDRRYYVGGKIVSREMFEKYDRSKIHGVIKVCTTCGIMWEALEALPCKLCEEEKLKKESEEKNPKKGRKESETKKESKKRSAERESRPHKKEHVSAGKYPSKFYVPYKKDYISVARYPSKVFDIKDMFELFKKDPLIVPLRSIYQVTLKRIANSMPSEPADFHYKPKVEIVGRLVK